MNKTDATQTWTDARGCVAYDKTVGVLSDCHSPVAVAAWETDQLGVAQFFLKGSVIGADEPLLCPCARLFLNFGPGWEPVCVTERFAWPGGWEERGMAGERRVRQRVWFAANDRFMIEWAFSGAEGHPPRVAVLGGGSPCPAILAGEATSDGWRLRFTSPRQDENGKPEFVMDLTANADWRVAALGFTAEAGIPTLPPDVASFSPALPGGAHGAYWCEFAPPTDGGASLRLCWRWCFNNEASEPDLAPRHEFSDALAWWQGALTALPECRPATTFWKRKLWQAANDCVTCSVRAPGYGNFDERMAVLAAPVQQLSTSYFWDAMMAVPVLGLLDPGWAVEVVECFTRQLELCDTAPPCLQAFPRIRSRRQWMGSQAPIAAWAIRKAMRCGGVRIPLARIYPALREIVDRWFRHADHDGDGMPEWRNTGAMADDSPLYDQYRSGQATCFYLPPHKSVSLSSYLLMEMRCLRVMSEELHLDGEVARWEARIAEFEGKILAELWHEDEAIFYDRDTTTGKPTRVKTFFNLLPLWAGMRLPEAQAHAAITRHLLNPEESWGAIPFPSTAYNEPTYNPLGYWRGRMWPHLYLWNTEILARYGYHDQAEEAKRRFLALIADGQQIFECYPSEIGSRHGKSGVPHYTFGTGTLVQFLLDWHLQPI